jgi:hypothetical protein
MVEEGGFGIAVPLGTKPVVISWRLANLRSAGLVVVAPPVSSSSWFLEVVVEITQERAWTMPTLPASGVPVGHFSPLVYAGTLVDGYPSLVLVNVNPVYPSANLPKVALLPASLALLGSMRTTPLPLVVSPEELEGEAGIAASMVPQMSKARPACHDVPMVGSTTVGVLL